MCKPKVTMFLLLLSLFIQPVHSAMVSGTVWDYSIMGPAEGFVVEVNTTPLQREVTGDSGEYFFLLEPGRYELYVRMVNASKELELVASQELRIEQEGNYTVDIPVLQSDFALPELPNESEFELPVIPEEKQAEPSYLMLALLFAISLVVLYFVAKRIWPQQGRMEKTGEPDQSEKKTSVTAPVTQRPRKERAIEAVPIQPSQKKEKLPKDLKEIVDIMKDNEGRITQKDLRKHIPLSEAKVSLMIAELESMGVVKKIKKGRGNILILKEK